VDLDTDFLRDLCLAPGVIGFLAPVERVVAERLAATTPDAAVTHDSLGTFTATGGGDPRIMLAAHADQIGAVVTGADERGFVWLRPSGLLDAEVMPGRLVCVHAAGGPREGVIGRMPSDLLPGGERATKASFDDLWLDLGAGSREEALSLVAIGDTVTFASRFATLAGGLVASQALDDRAGVYAIVRALELRAESTSGAAGLAVVATTGEETSFLGARAVAAALRPEVVVVVDVIWASDHPRAGAQLAGGDVRLGAGPVLSRGGGMSERLAGLTRDAAADVGIPLQVRAVAGATLSDADELLPIPGAETLALSIPLRYMHSPFEVASGADVERTAQLIAAVVGRLQAASPAV